MHENRKNLCSFRNNFNPLCLALHAGGETCLISVDVVEYLGNKIIPTTWSQRLPSLGNVFGRREKALCIEICFYVDIEYNIQSNVWNWKKTIKPRSMSFLQFKFLVAFYILTNVCVKLILRHSGGGGESEED